jgi:hypothetical protein
LAGSKHLFSEWKTDDYGRKGKPTLGWEWNCKEIWKLDVQCKSKEEGGDSNNTICQ